VTDNNDILHFVKKGMSDPYSVFPHADGWHSLDNVNSLMTFMDRNPNCEYFIAWSSESSLWFDYSHPENSPIKSVSVLAGTFKINWEIKPLTEFLRAGGTVRIKAGETIAPPLPTNPTDKIYDVVVATAPWNNGNGGAEVTLVEAIRDITGMWTGYTKEGYVYTEISPSAIKNFRPATTQKDK